MHYKIRRVWLAEFHARGGVGVPGGGMPPQGGIPSKDTSETTREHHEDVNAIASETPPAPPQTPSLPCPYPPEIFSGFQREILEKVCSSPKALQDAIYLSRQAQEFFTDTQMSVFEPLLAQRLADWIATQTLSISYTQKLTYLMNRFGQYIEYYHNTDRRHFHKLKSPSGKALIRIKEAFAKSSGGGNASLPLTRHMLAQARKRLTDAEYNWMYVSFYLGLRPSEVDALAIAGAFALVERQGLRWLKVFQAKLVHLPPERRWKAIPLLYPSQKKAARLALAGGLKRPNTAKLKRIFKGRQVTAYAGRKGYASMMLGKGVSFAAISKLLGHKSEKLTRAVYSDPFEVQMAELSNLFGKKGEA